MNWALHLQDLVRGTRIIKTKKELEKSDFWTKEQLETYQLQKLQKLISFCYRHVPYYSRLFDSIGLKPDDIRNLEDIQKIPVLTKEIVRREHANLFADNVDASSRKIKKAKTGGTTGMPLAFYKDSQTRDYAWGAYYRWYNWMGIRDGDREAVLWGSAIVLKESWQQKLKSHFVNRISNTLFINSFRMSEKILPSIAEQLISFKPIILRGYLSAILQVAKYFKEHNLSLPSLKAISSTTETLLPIYRDYIEEAFNVKMFDQYGCGECNGMAFECTAHKGLHVNEEHCLLEILDESGNYCYDKPGRVILTDLDNYAFPFIRYENGDSAILKTEACDCGRSSHLLKSISGRTADVIYLKDGSSVHGVFFTDIFHELGYSNFEYFTRFQIYQKRKGDFICRLEKTSKDLPQKEKDKLKEVLQKYGEHVELEIVEHLENDKSGKFRYIISDIKD